MARLGQLERAVMDTLWELSSSSPGATFTARDVAHTLPHHAYTTVLTVIDRLTRKGLIERIRDGKTHHYLPTGSRESYVAELMHEALATTTDREAALVRFAQTVPDEQAKVLRDVLGGVERAVMHGTGVNFLAVSSMVGTVVLLALCFAGVIAPDGVR